MDKKPKSNTGKRQSPSPAQQTSGFCDLDIGSPQLTGSARQVEGGWDIVAGGVDIWEKSDQFHFVHNPQAGAKACFRDYTEFKQ